MTNIMVTMIWVLQSVHAYVLPIQYMYLKIQNTIFVALYENKYILKNILYALYITIYTYTKCLI